MLARAGRERGESASMSEVIIHDDESFERALKRFKKKCEKAGILSDLRKHRHYEKPSEKKKRKMAAAIRKTRRGPRIPRVSPR
jgi:small subunit ribosomal protein S21